MAKETRPRQLTFMGQRAEYKEIREAGPDGVREIRIRWIDSAKYQPIEWPAGTIVSKTVKGNLRRGTFEVLIEEHQVDEF